MFKKTLHITGIIDTTQGKQFEYDYMIVDTRHDLESSVRESDFKNDLFKDKKYVPKEKDKLYFLPGCNIPRFKLKEFCNTHKIAPVKYRVRANVVIVGPDSYRELYTTKTTSRISYDIFKKWMDNISPLGDLRFLQLKNDLTHVNENFEYITLNREVFQKLLSNETPFNLRINLNKTSTNSGFFEGEYSYLLCLKDQESLDIMNEMSKPDSIFYGQDDILSELNTGMVLDDSNFDNIRNLFTSNDTENTKLAMECMANCDYKKSAVQILLLLQEFGQKIGGTKNKDHVNFKALLTYFGITNLYHVTIDDIVESLISKDLLSQESLDLFLPEVQKIMTDKKGFKHFSVGTILLSDDIKNALAKHEKIVEEEKEKSIVSVAELKENIDSFKPVLIGEPVVVEKSSEGAPLMSMQAAIMDLGNPNKDVDLLSPTSDTDLNFDL